MKRLTGLVAALTLAVPLSAQDHYQSSPERRTVAEKDAEKDWGRGSARSARGWCRA